MNFFPVEFIASRELHSKLAKKILQDTLLGRLYYGNMFFAEKLLDFFYILFIFDFDDDFHDYSPES
jgi:hypothetical protein